MGALAHYLESEGLPTTQISLIREHTETIRPPRALWVPFELGRPLGTPGNPAFQQRVLMEALRLLEAPEGPLLVDFTEEAPQGAARGDEGLEGWSCPIIMTSEAGKETDMELLLAAFKREVAELRPWYDLSLEERKRTGVVEFGPQSSSEVLSSFLTGEKPLAGQEKFSLALALRLAAHDLKAFYFEAATARPGSASPSSGKFNRWFWQDTAAGRILKAVKERCMQESDESLKKTCAMLLVPLDQ